LAWPGLEIGFKLESWLIVKEAKVWEIVNLGLHWKVYEI